MVSYFATNALILLFFGNVAGVDRPVNKYGVVFTKLYEFVLVLLVVLVVVTNEYFVHCLFCR